METQGVDSFEPHTFAKCPTFRGQREANFVFLGISGHATSGVTYPETACMVREASMGCSHSAMWGSSRPPGWYCLNRKKQLLSGAWCYDAGDFAVGGDTEIKLRDLLKQVALCGAKPIFFGGDHRVTGWVAEQITGPLQILHLDAHRDTGPVNGELNPKNVVSYILTLPHIKNVVTVGVRGVIDLGSGDNGREEHPIFSMNDLRTLGMGGPARSLDPALPVYVSFDADVIDPILAPAVCNPEPDGLNLLELRKLMAPVFQTCKVIGWDIVEACAGGYPIHVKQTGKVLFLALLTLLDLSWTHSVTSFIHQGLNQT